MQPTEIARAIGAFETGLLMTNRRIDDLRREVMAHVAVLRKSSGTNGRKLPWAQFAAMGLVALTSILGLIKPETAASVFKALLRAGGP